MHGKKFSEAGTATLSCQSENSSMKLVKFAIGCAKLGTWPVVGGMDGSGVSRKISAVSLDACIVHRTVTSSRVSAGFSVFFTIFELTRRAAAEARTATQAIVQERTFGLRTGMSDKFQRQLPRVAHAVTLVSGGAFAGLVYELCSRPWDAARKAVHVDKVVCSEHHSIASILRAKVRDEGWASFVKLPVQHTETAYSSPMHRRLHSVARTLARVGPWGVGFLVWESFGPGIS